MTEGELDMLLEEALSEARAERHRGKKGYGNDSRQNGPLSSRILHIAPAAEFAYSVETRTRRLRGRGVPGPRYPSQNQHRQRVLQSRGLVLRSRGKRTGFGMADRLRTPNVSTMSGRIWCQIPPVAWRWHRSRLSQVLLMSSLRGRMAHFVANRCHTRWSSSYSWVGGLRVVCVYCSSRLRERFDAVTVWLYPKLH
jgi:hypothetical protein